ncbi:MAG: glycosyltransferase family 2 protein [Thermodesulfovibrionales bacterium]
MNNIKLPLSVAIITKNEEEMLPDCLRSISFADDIVVVDSESTDRTVEIAKEFKCRVFTEPWKGFGPQKMSAVEKCRHDWILIMDADERIPAETKEAIISVINGTDTADAYSFPRKAFYNGRWIRHCGWWPDEIIRMFRKDKGSVSNRAVHEGVEVMGMVAKLSAPIVHYPMPNIEAVVAKIRLYSSLGAKELLTAGKSSSFSKAFLHATASFIKSYFFKLGILDGGPGFLISYTGAATTYYKYIRLIELRKAKGP